MAAAVVKASELWKLESWLTQRRLESERKYDYRYSMLPLVFATLVKQGRITENDLRGLDPEKMELILAWHRGCKRNCSPACSQWRALTQT